MADLGGNYTNVNVKGTNECCATCTKDTMMDQRINSAGYVLERELVITSLYAEDPRCLR